MTERDKAEFLECTKAAMATEQGVPWEFVEAKIIQDIESIFDDEKFVNMDPEFRIDAAYARKAFGDRKPEIVDYLLWAVSFVTNSEYAEW